MNDKDYMRLALQLAKKGCGWTSPNPMVGAVVVKAVSYTHLTLPTNSRV